LRGGGRWYPARLITWRSSVRVGPPLQKNVNSEGFDKFINYNDIYIETITMGIFDNNDDFFNNDDFMNRWEKFNNRMMNDEEFKKEMEKAQKDFKELIKMMLLRSDFGTPLDFRIIPLNSREDFRKDFKIPDNEMDVEKGQDENGEWETKSWTSPDGSVSYNFFSRSSGFGDINSMSDDIADRWKEKLNRKKESNSEEIKNEKLAKLKMALDRAVELERYEKAAEIKKMMDELKSEDKK